MSGRWTRRGNGSANLQQRLPFTNADAVDAEEVNTQSSGSLRSRLVPGAAARAQSVSGGYLSSSVGQRQPTRSFFHYASHGHADPLQYASPGVREQTQELANWALGDSPSHRRLSIGHDEASATGSERRGRRRTISTFSEAESDDPRTSTDSTRPEAIVEVSEPVSPEEREGGGTDSRQHASALSSMIRNTQSQKGTRYLSVDSPEREDDEDSHSDVSIVVDDYDTGEVTETSALLPRARLSAPRQKRAPKYKHADPGFAEQQRAVFSKRWDWFKFSTKEAFAKATNPREWDVKQASSAAVGALAAVFLGLLLNILDALSYGMILFPLGEEIFEKTGPDGISMFYVSCIVSQLVYSLGGSRFAGGVGSEMIEVVPFMHKM